MVIHVINQVPITNPFPRAKMTFNQIVVVKFYVLF